jgi:hypothetical protein
VSVAVTEVRLRRRQPRADLFATEVIAASLSDPEPVCVLTFVRALLFVPGTSWQETNCGRTNGWVNR